METFRLYENHPEPVVVQFDVDGSTTGAVHSYWIDGRQRMGVTGITGAIDKSYSLVPWAVNQTIDFLKANWPAWNPSLEERLALFEEAKKAHENTRDTAASIGKDVHSWIEEYIMASMKFMVPPPMPFLDKKVLSATTAYCAWEAENHVQYIASEKLVYSKKFDYCGTLDLKARVNGRLSILDFKTSNGYRDEWRPQTAAYLKADEEEFPEHKYEDRWILMLNKSNGKFKPIPLGIDTVDEDFECFLHAMGIRKWQEKIKRMKQEAN